MTAKKLATTPSSEDYADASVLAHDVGKHMIERLEWMTIAPKVIVDLGCGVGSEAVLLKKRYPDAAIIAIDHAEKYLSYAAQHHTADVAWICAEAEILPLPDHSVDLIFANLLLPWFDDIKKTMREWRRILRPEGLLLFSSLGPDTLKEWQGGFSEYILPVLMDMHDLGDELVRARFIDPVLDMEYLTVTYRELEKLTQELQVTGMLAADLPVIKGEPDSGGVFPVTYEVIYGHAFGPDFMVDQVADESGVVKIPLAHLRRR